MNHSALDTGDDAGGFNNSPGKNREPRWDEKIPWYSFADDGNPYRFRLVGKPSYFFNHWVTTKKRDGQWGKPLAVLCKNYNSLTGKNENNGCKVCELQHNFSQVYGQQNVEWQKWPEQIKKLSARPTTAINAICRDLQEQGPPPGAKDWSFVVPLKLPKGVSETIIDKAKKFNKTGQIDPNTKEPGFYGLNHAEYGKDIFISYNSQAEVAKMYDIQIGMADRDRTPLTPEERNAAIGQMHTFADKIKYMADQNVDEILQRGGYYDLLQTIQAQSALKTAQARVGLDTTPPPAQEIPRTPPVQQHAPAQTAPPVTQTAAVPPALDTGEDGGMKSTEEDLPNQSTQSATSSASSAPAASPVQAPASQVAASPGVTNDPIVAFATAHGKGVKGVTEDYSSFSLRTVKTGSSVPVCFSQYSHTKVSEPALCKACPIKLDCMQVEP